MRGLILAAGGSSTRFGGETPKVLAGLGDRPVIVHALEAFLAVDARWDVVVPAPEALREAFEAVLGDRARVVTGGDTRQASVAAGLAALDPKADPVLVHDAARPLVAPDTIQRVLDAIDVEGAAAAVLPVVDSIHTVALDGAHVEETLDRSRVVRAQTPQGARRELLERAFRSAEEDGRVATDEIALLRDDLTPVCVVAGNARNIKITTPDDLTSAAHWLTNDSNET